VVAAATPYTPPSGGSSSGSGGGGGGAPATSSNSGNKITNVSANSAETKAAVQAAVQQAAQIASQTGTAAVVDVKLKNVGEISAETAKAIIAQAGGQAAVLTAQSLSPDGKSVDVQIQVDLSKITGTINLAASSTSQEARKTNNVFAKFFANETQTLHCEQKGSFGQPVSMAAKIAKDMPTDNLTFYSYNAETNTFVQIQTQYWVDANGYVHFTTELANDIIISDGPLAKK
jgi:hypothetical protein